MCQPLHPERGRAVQYKTGARVRALGVVHVFGNMADMPRLLDIARRYKLVLIEDATEALGTRYTAGPLAGKAAAPWAISAATALTATRS